MTTFIMTRTSDGKELCRKQTTNNWFNVYQNRARMEGRRMRWIDRNSYEVIFAEKNYTVTLIKNMEE